MHHSKILVCALALLGLSSAPALVSAPAAAEGFLDLYMGASFPENGDVDARASSPSIFAASINDRIEYDTSFTGGLRGGYWFEDAANFTLLMARIPIAVEEDFPGGRVQPYGAIGPGFTLSVALADLSELGIGIDDLADASFDLGLDVRGGLAIHVAKPIALFAEYRYTRLRPEYDDEVDFDFGPDIDIDIEPDLDVHHLVFGVSFRF
jgi:opacity protein-like surface antigen